MIAFGGDFDQLEDDFKNMVKSVEECLDDAFKAIILYLNEGENEEVRRLNKKVNASESRADDYRRNIIRSILKGSLMPNTRADILNLIEAIDDVADNMEDALEEIIFLNLDFCCINEDKFLEIMDLIEKQYAEMTEGVDLLFTDMSQALVYARRLEEIESEIDDIEESLIREIGQIPDITIAEKIIHRQLIKNVSDIANIIENVGDHIEIIVSVRKA